MITCAKKVLLYTLFIALSVCFIVSCGNTESEPAKTPDTISIESLLDDICSSPVASSNPGDYIEEHKDEYEEILSHIDEAFDYITDEFEKGGQDDLRGHIMASVCRDALGDEDIKLYAETGQIWYDEYKKYTTRILELNGVDFVKENMPRATRFFKIGENASIIK